MKRYGLGYWVLFLIFGLFLASCGSADVMEETAVSTSPTPIIPTATIAPTPTLAAPATAVPATDDAPLTTRVASPKVLERSPRWQQVQERRTVTK